MRTASCRCGWALSLLALLALSGCKQPIYSHLTEAEANDVLLTLIRGGVEAEKRQADENTFSVVVPEAAVATAIELLRADAQPSEHYANLGEVFARNGLISSPTEERVRYIYGLQQELAKTLSQIDGVLVARVHIVLPTNDPFEPTAKPSSASVFLKHRADLNMQLALPSVKELVVRSIEGLSSETVSVTLFPARATLTAPAQLPVTQFFGALVASSSVSTLWLVFAVPWIIVAALIVLLVHAARVRELLHGLMERRTAASRTPAEPPPAAADDLDLLGGGRHHA